MKNHFKISILLLSGLVAFSCDNSTDDTDNHGLDYTLLLENYVNNTIIATYADMQFKSKQLYADVAEFVVTGEQANLDSACASWRLTRAPWESGEAFLFGPAAYNSLDPLLDSWPLDQVQLEQVLAGDQELTAAFVRDGLGAVLRGFHTIEYLLFRDGENRKVTDFTEREKDYLLAVTQVLRDDCITLWALWEGVEAGTPEAQIIEELGVDVSVPYKNEFINAGKAGSRYVSQYDAVDEILQGILDIADEVANGKLADPYTTKDVLSVESWHSWNSLTDFKNNVRSIQNAYLGGYLGSEGAISLSQVVKELDANLDAAVLAKIDAAIVALNNIPEPFRNSLNDDVTVPAAIDAVADIFEIFSEEVKPLILD